MAKTKQLVQAKLTQTEAKRIMDFLDSFTFTQKQWERSYPQWSKAPHGWNGCRMGGTYQMKAIMWFHYCRHKPNYEWRPSLILKALKEVVA